MMDAEAAETFLRVLFAGYVGCEGLRAEVRCRGSRGGWMDGKPPRDWWPLTEGGLRAAARTAVGKTWGGRWDCYVGVLPRMGRGGDAASVTRAACLWCEVDGQDAGQDGAWWLLEEAVREGRVPAPAMIVGSGGGVHGYWPIAPVMDVTDGAMRGRMASILRRIAVGVGGVRWGRHGVLVKVDACAPFADPSCCEIARVLRIPGTFNHKPSRQCAVRLLVVNEGYGALPLAWWGANMLIEPAPEERTERSGERTGLYPATIARVTEGAPAGERQRNRVAIAVAAAKAGLDAEGVQILLDTQARVCGSPGHVYRGNANLARWAVRKAV